MAAAIALVWSGMQFLSGKISVNQCAKKNNKETRNFYIFGTSWKSRRRSRLFVATFYIL